MEKCLILVVVLQLLKISSSDTAILSRVQYKDESIKLNNVTIETDQEARSLLRYLNYSTIQFLHPCISTLSIEVLDQMLNLHSLGGFQGHVNELHISSQLLNIDFYKTHITTIEIDPVRDYKLKKLEIKEANLQALPKNLNALKELELIGFERNKIQHVDTADLTDLPKLQKLNLQHNRISKISSSLNNPVNLPSLKVLFLFANQLSEISFEHWNAASLKILELDRNRLSIVHSLFSAFPALEKLKLQGNPLNCHWKDMAYKELTARRVQIDHSPVTKCSKVDPSAGIRAFDSDIFQARQNKMMNASSAFRMQNSKLEQSERQINELQQSIKQSNITFSATISNMQEQMSQSATQIQQLERSNSDLSVAFQEQSSRLNETEQQISDLKVKIQQLQRVNEKLTASFRQTADNVSATLSENEGENNV